MNTENTAGTKSTAQTTPKSSGIQKRTMNRRNNQRRGGGNNHRRQPQAKNGFNRKPSKTPHKREPIPTKQKHQE